MSAALRILLIEDEAADVALVERELNRLGRAISLCVVESESGFLRALTEFAPDLVLSDLNLPGFSGLQALALVRAHRPGLPFIFVSGSIDGEAAVDLLKDGATDYVLKDHLRRLNPAITRGLRERQLEREHRQAEENYRGIFENAVLGIYQISPDGAFLAVNHALARQFGYGTSPEMLADSARLTARFVDPRRAEEFLALLSTQGEVRNFEAEMLGKDGGRLWVAQHARLLQPAPGGGMARCEGFVEDITRQREMEAQMQRTRRLESIGTLAGGVAHDLNNVMSPILMAASILHQQPPGQEHERMVSLIENSARRGAQIIKQVLAFGSAVEGERRTLQVNYLVKDVLKVMADTSPNGIILESSAERGLLPTLGDPGQLRQVLLDLCTNARDAMPDGGLLQLRVRNATITAPSPDLPTEAGLGQYVLLEVSDSGPGIPPEILDRIFDPYFTTKGVGKGTGLGLSAVRGIVKSHGGVVHVISDPGTGTTFQVYLPAIRAAATTTTRAAPRTRAPRGHGETVLLVDDEETIRLAVCTVLGMHNYRVITANDGISALGTYQEHASDIALVLTDLAMPLMDGLALTRALKRLRPDLPVIVSSGRSEKSRLDELVAMGIRRVLDKPYATETLLRTVDEALHQAEVPVPA